MARAERPYFLHILAYLLGAEETVVLAAEQERLRPGRLECATTVEFSPPAVGRYQLLGTVVLSHCDVPGVAVGPMLRVVP